MSKNSESSQSKQKSKPYEWAAVLQQANPQEFAKEIRHNLEILNRTLQEIRQGNTTKKLDPEFYDFFKNEIVSFEKQAPTSRAEVDELMKKLNETFEARSLFLDHVNDPISLNIEAGRYPAQVPMQKCLQKLADQFDIRPIRGDNNSLFTSIATGLLEAILKNKKLLEKINKKLKQLKKEPFQLTFQDAHGSTLDAKMLFNNHSENLMRTLRSLIKNSNIASDYLAEAEIETIANAFGIRIGLIDTSQVVDGLDEEPIVHTFGPTDLPEEIVLLFRKSHYDLLLKRRTMNAKL